MVASRIRPRSVLILALGEDYRAAPDLRLASELGARVAVVPTDEDEEEAMPGEEPDAGRIVVVSDAGALRSLVSGLAA